MKSIFEPQARDEVRARIRKLTPQTVRRWGTMTVDKAVVHMSDQIRMGLGEIPLGPPRGLLRLSGMSYLMIHVLPWPKGRATGPQEAFTNHPDTFEADVAILGALIDQISSRGEAGEWPHNPVFGKMTGRDWGVLTYRHLDHHLRQFGC